MGPAGYADVRSPSWQQGPAATQTYLSIETPSEIDDQQPTEPHLSGSGDSSADAAGIGLAQQQLHSSPHA